MNGRVESYEMLLQVQSAMAQGYSEDNVVRELNKARTEGKS